MSRIVSFFSGKFEPREYSVRRSDGVETSLGMGRRVSHPGRQLTDGDDATEVLGERVVVGEKLANVR